MKRRWVLITRPHPSALMPGAACIGCSCTERWACAGGCFWVFDRLCSRCAGADLRGLVATVPGPMAGLWVLRQARAARR